MYAIKFEGKKRLKTRISIKNGVCDTVGLHFAVGANEANEASPAITQLRRTGAIDAPRASRRRVSRR